MRFWVACEYIENVKIEDRYSGGSKIGSVDKTGLTDFSNKTIVNSQDFQKYKNNKDFNTKQVINNVVV